MCTSSAYLGYITQARPTMQRILLVSASTSDKCRVYAKVHSVGIQVQLKDSVYVPQITMDVFRFLTGYHLPPSTAYSRN